MKNDKQNKVTIFPEEKAKNFAGRMQKRTCREELELAGFKAEQLDVMTTFQDSDLIENRRYNVPHAGIAFEYEKWNISNGAWENLMVKEFGSMKKALKNYSENGGPGPFGGNWLKYFASHLGTDYDGFFPYVVDENDKKNEDTFVVVSCGLGWNDKKTGGYSVDAAYNNKYVTAYKSKLSDSSYPAYYTGWAPYYPKQYFIVVSDEYLTK